MGVVHLGLDEEGRAVAVKVLRPHLAADPQARARLAREADTLRLVRSPRVAEVLDTDPDADPPYIVTEYVAAPPLDEHVADVGPLRGRDLVRLGLGLGEALSAIHRAGVVHRDLKPANVLVDEGEPVVIDFGIAQIADDVRLTSTGLVMGTPGYLSPEVIDGAPVSVVGDWWGWAATMVFAATGRPPFGTGPLDAVLSRVHRGAPDVAGVPEPFAGLLVAALAPDPDDRPTPRALREALHEALGPGAGRAPELAPTTAVDLREPEPAPAAGAAASAGVTALVGPHPAATAGAAATRADADATAVHPVPVAAAPAPAALTTPVTRPAPERHLLPPADPWSELPVTAAVPERAVVPAGTVRPPQRDDGWQHAERLAPREDRGGGSVRAGDLVAAGDGPPDAPAPRGPSPGALLGLLLLAIAAVAAVAPVWVAVVLAVGSVLARTLERSTAALERRRLAHGARGSDAAVAALSAPGHLLAAAGVSAPALLLPLLMGVSAGALAGWALGPPSTAAPGLSLALAVGALSAVLTAWWGPAGGSLRGGTRQLVRAVARGPRSGAVLAAVLALVIAAAVVVVGSGGQPDWSPLPGPPLGLGAGP